MERTDHARGNEIIRKPTNSLFRQAELYIQNGGFYSEQRV
jgi:hypothetical protein